MITFFSETELDVKIDRKQFLSIQIVRIHIITDINISNQSSYIFLQIKQLKFVRNNEFLHIRM